MPTSHTGRLRSAAVLVIGDEILSGRTQDSNLGSIARFLAPLGIPVLEARVVPDKADAIIQALNALRARHTYVFTTGGIGPTHDDITADAVAAAFGVGIDFHPEALAVLAAHYPPGAFNEARRKMARVPDGALLIDNPVSRAPGFEIGNVFVLAGIPKVMQAMLESLAPRLTGGPPLLSQSLSAYVAEGTVAAGLEALQTQYPDLSFGSYPFYRQEKFGTSLVVRGTDPARLTAAIADLRTLLTGLGAPIVDPAPH